MNSLRASSQAMRKAGLGVDAKEAEKVMNELEDHIEDASEVTAALSTPLLSSGLDGDLGLGMDDVDRELGLIADEDAELLAGLVAAPPAMTVTVDIPSAPYTMSLPAAHLPPQYARQSIANVDF